MTTTESLLGIRTEPGSTPNNRVENTRNFGISRVAVKIAPLNSQDPRLWLKILEAQFNLIDITAEKTRYYHLLSALSDRVTNDLSDIILSPLSPTPYSDIKKAILVRFGESKNTRMQQLLQRIEIGDMKPSQLYRKLKVHGGSDITDDLLKTIWLKRLPIHTQEILAPAGDTLSTEKLAELADRIVETGSQNNVMAVSKSSIPNANSNQPDSILANQICEIIKRLDNMDQSARQDRGRNSSPHARRFARRPRSNSRKPEADTSGSPKPCYFHARFKDSARNCKPGCSRWDEFKSKN